MNKINWENGTLVSPAKVEIGGVIYEVIPEQYSGNTPLSAENLNQMEDNIEEAIDEKVVDEYSESTTKGYSANYINELNTYSTEEQRIGTWIDGKPLYRKVVNFNIDNSTTNWQTIDTISNLDNVINLYGFVNFNSTENYPLIMSYYNNNQYQATSWYWIKSAGTVSFRHNYGYINGKSAHAIIEYTKTTD